MKKYIDIVVLVPLEEELKEFRAHLPNGKDVSTDKEFRRHVVVENTSLLIVHQSDMGYSSAGDILQSVMHEYQFGLAVCLGIAGGLSNDLKLGDVVYSGGILDIYNNAKAVETDVGAEMKFSPDVYATEARLEQLINFQRIVDEINDEYTDWQDACTAFAQAIGLTEIPDPDPENAPISHLSPKSLNGDIACGPVIASETYKNKVAALQRRVLAVDTESGAVFRVCGQHEIAALTIRGISDYADSKKSKLEGTSKQKYRRLASHNASKFFLSFLSSPRMFDFLLSKRSVLDPQFPGLGDVKLERSDSLVRTLGRLTDVIEDHLREMSPEYRLQKRGYRLPSPRIVSNRPNQDSDYEDENIPESISARLEQESILYIDLPQTYPELSLPWVYAHALSLNSIDGKPIAPIVINGSKIRPPNMGIKKLNEFADEIHEFDGQVTKVYIIDQLPLSSRTRMEFIQEEIAAHGDSKFILINRKTSNIESRSDFIHAIAADPYDISEISFEEIAKFVQANFDMHGSEAQVVAYRLHNTFAKFNLMAHPSYFAGIPRETLAALLQANRRSELLQLAVDGLLLYLVSEDEAEILLSRTTRSRFLRSLAFEINCSKRNFDEAELVKFVQEIAKLHDYDIVPLKFIQDFIEKGIISFSSGNVQFSLPFVEQYLLAVELSERPEDATLYFDGSNDIFDVGTFDIYSEIKPNPVIVTQILKHLEESQRDLKKYQNKQHSLLDGSTNPRLILDQKKMGFIRKQLDDAKKATAGSEFDLEEKQKVIDISKKVKRRSRRESDWSSEKEDTPIEIKILNSASRIWTIGTILLGSGAEHLEATTKRKLSRLLIQTGSLIVDVWTQQISKTDFETMKEELSSDEIYREVTGEPEESPKEEKKKRERFAKMVSNIADFWEFASLGEPFYAVLHHLTEHARQKVLVKSIENSRPDNDEEGVKFDQFEELIRGVWLADIDAVAGKTELRAAIANLPRADFCRVSLASHFMVRVYWNHWKVEDKEVLLDAAEGALRPLNLSFDKSKIKRMIHGSGSSPKLDG